MHGKKRQGFIKEIKAKQESCLAGDAGNSRAVDSLIFLF